MLNPLIILQGWVLINPFVDIVTHGMRVLNNDASDDHNEDNGYGCDVDDEDDNVTE